MSAVTVTVFATLRFRSVHDYDCFVGLVIGNGLVFCRVNEFHGHVSECRGLVNEIRELHDDVVIVNELYGQI